MHWRLRPFVVAWLLGLAVIAIGVTVYAASTMRAEARVANGVAVTGQVVDATPSRGPDTIAVRYAYDARFYETRLRSLLGSAADYVEGAETTVYLDPSNPASAALPGGFASDGGYWLVLLPAPAAAIGAAIVVSPTIRLFRHRVAHSSDFDGLGNPENMPDLSVGIRVGAEDMEHWLPPYHSLKRHIESGKGHGVRLYVELMIERAGIGGTNPEFRGVRVGPLSRDRRIIKVAVVVPETETRPPDQALLSALARAVDAAEEYLDRKGLRGQLGGARAALRRDWTAGPALEAINARVTAPRFTAGFRGYDIWQVDAILREARLAADSADAARRSAALARLQTSRLRTRLRGYDRQQVDGYFKLLEQALR